MLDQIKGLHHVTSMASDARENNDFFTHKLGLRRVKKTVNFDAPDVYHLYYGDEVGTPGSVMTYFPFPNIGKGRHGVGEVGTTVFSVPEGTLGWWRERLAKDGVGGLKQEASFGQDRMFFDGPDGDSFALVEDKGDKREPRTHGGVPAEQAIRGFHSASLRLKDGGATEELLKFTPDVVLAGTYTSPFTRTMLRRLGFSVVELEPEASIADIERNVRLVAQVVGQVARGEQLVAALRDEVRAIEANRPARRLAAVIVRPGGFTVGADSLANELLTLVGLVSGVWPARRAASLFPAEALRAE